PAGGGAVLRTDRALVEVVLEAAPVGLRSDGGDREAPHAAEAGYRRIAATGDPAQFYRETTERRRRSANLGLQRRTDSRRRSRRRLVDVRVRGLRDAPDSGDQPARGGGDHGRSAAAGVRTR